MDHNTFLLSLVFVLLIFSQEIQLSNGRQLKPGKTAEFPVLHTPQVGTKTLMAQNVNLPNDHARGAYVKELQSTSSVQLDDDTRPSPPQGHMDDFRPTAPGRSPGVGHSLQN
ncbi:hypothetical protein Ancab_003770 [Ancistrocladus abbreviatus]